MPNHVTEVPAAMPDEAVRHFSAKLAFETDCWDVHECLKDGATDFVVLDVRGPISYARGHVPGAINMPYRKIIGSKMDAWPRDTLFVVYCAGPQCNGADKAALRLARLGRPVKLMIGGISGWREEGFPFAQGEQPGSLRELAAAV